MQKLPFKISTAQVDPAAGTRTRTPKTSVVPGKIRRTIPDRVPRLRRAPFGPPSNTAPLKPKA
jgi:hypothetical protein